MHSPIESRDSCGRKPSAKGLPVKIYGEYVENESFLQPNGSTDEPSWSDLYTDSQNFESGAEPTLYYQNTITSEASVPAVSNYLIKNFPPFDLNIPDQFRVDLWLQDFNKDVAAGTVPALSVLWIMDDHTGGPPDPDAEQADNDLAVGRIIDYISHSNVWSSSAIFIEEDDAQNGVDHVDGHRSPGYVVSPYAVQGGRHRPHLLHAGQHDADDRANPRSAAHEPVRSRGITDAYGFR